MEAMLRTASALFFKAESLGGYLGHGKHTVSFGERAGEGVEVFGGVNGRVGEPYTGHLYLFVVAQLAIII